MKNLNSIFKFMLKVTLPLLIVLGVMLWAPIQYNSALAYECCKLNGTYTTSSWEDAEFVTCCYDTSPYGHCVVKKRRVYADDWECDDVDPLCQQEYYDPDECWYKCCNDAPVIVQTPYCEIGDKVHSVFEEIVIDGVCADDCFCDQDTCIHWYTPVMPATCN